MKKATTITQWIVRITGMTQVLLGILLWTHLVPRVLPTHILVGMLFVAAIWVLGGLAAVARLHWMRVLVPVLWSAAIPVFGMMQIRLLPGPYHWIVQVAHLLMGLVAMDMAARLVRSMNGRAVAGVPDQPAGSAQEVFGAASVE